MFIGHFAVGLASKRLAPRAGLGPLLAAPLLLDLLWPAFLLTGWERVRIEPGAAAFKTLVFEHYPWSHSLLLAGVWGALFALVYRAKTGYRTGAIVIAAGVVSHWVLDWVTHGPDLPLWPGSSPLLGLGLWNSVAGTVVVESLMLGAAVWLYAAGTRALDRTGRWAFWGFVTVLVLLYVASVLSPPPPNVPALAVGALSGLVFPFWAAWFDRHRESRPPSVA